MRDREAEEGEERRREGGREHWSETAYLLSVRNTEVFDNNLFLPISSSTKWSILVLLRRSMNICYKTHNKNLSLGERGDNSVKCITKLEDK